MPAIRPFAVLLFANLASLAASQTLCADDAAAKAALAAKGIRVTHVGLSLKEEADLSKAFGEAASLKKKLTAALRSYRDLENRRAQSQETFDVLLQQSVVLNRQMKSVTPSSNLSLYNSLVGEVNATQGELLLLDATRKETEKRLDESRAALHGARDKYVEKIAQIRELADRVSAKYVELAKDEEVQKALQDWNASIDKPLKLEPSHTFQNTLKRLESLEKTVDTEKISLRRAQGGLLATVVINGSHTHEMLIDTGATQMLLPHSFAVQLGLDLDSAPSGKGQIADGSVVDIKHVRLESVRLGKFTAKNVDCGVAPPQAANAPSLLGMSFLGRFDVQLNGAELTLSKLDSDTGAPTKRKPATKSTKKPAPMIRRSSTNPPAE